MVASISLLISPTVAGAFELALLGCALLTNWLRASSIAVLRDLKASDMITINNRMKRRSGGSIDVMPEVTLEYAAEIAAMGSKQPVEFFTNLPASESMAVKNAVLGFLFGSE